MKARTTKKKIAVDEEKPVFVGFVNTDTTEGRGFNVPLYVTEIEATAIRLGKGRNVQGSPAEVRKATAFRIGGLWYGPIHPIVPTAVDERLEAETQRERAKEKLILSAINKAKELGLTDEEIDLINSK